LPPPVAVKTLLVMAHVKLFALDAETTGTLVFAVTLLFVLAVQPFAAVTVTV
jgi:hypothetical protein